jgi:hypothetical protein
MKFETKRDVILKVRIKTKNTDVIRKMLGL